MREPQRTTIGAWVYSVRPLPAGAGLALMARLARMAGPGVAGLLEGGGGGAIGRALAGLLERVSPDEIVEVARQLAGTTEVSQPGGRAPAQLSEVFDVHFAGDYLALVDWLRFALEVNFGPFVVALATRLGRAAPPAA
jgi:hypothetical protein